MWIHPVYQGAAAFEQSLTYLQTNAFDLFHMEPFGEDEAEKMTFGMHGREKTLGLEVDFRRSVRDVVKHAEADRQATILKLYKLAFMAFMKGGLALGLQALKQADALGGTFFTDAEGAAPACYLAFLAETWVHLRNMDKHLPIPPNLSRYVYERRQREHDYATAGDENTRQALLRADGESRREFDWKYRGDLE